MANTFPEIIFAVLEEIPEDMKAVKVFGQYVPQEFEIDYYVLKKPKVMKTVFKVGMKIMLDKNGKAQTRSLEFEDSPFELTPRKRKDVKDDSTIGRFTLNFPNKREFLDFEEVKRITSSTRILKHFQSLAVAMAIETYELEDGSWGYSNLEPRIESPRIKVIEKKYFRENYRAPRSNIDYEQVAYLYKEAKANGYRIKEHISINYEGSTELRDIPLPTVNGWIKTCREKKLIPKSNYGNKKVSASKAGSKATPKTNTTKGKK